MMNRRGALVAIGITSLGGLESLASAGGRLALGTENGDTALQTDLERLGKRIYSEEGIPMFLACENLTQDDTVSKPAAPPSPLNQKVSSAFDRYASEWQRIRPDAPAADVAKIVELLADRDVSAGGAEKSL